MTMQEWLWSADGAAAALVVVAGLADWRRSRRHDLDDTGWVPWRGVQMAGFFAVVIFAVLALRV
jgi:hypothetical protein